MIIVALFMGYTTIYCHYTCEEDDSPVDFGVADFQTNPHEHQGNGSGESTILGVNSLKNEAYRILCIYIYDNLKISKISKYGN